MSSSATVRVEKATSDLLVGPDWTMNIDICDSVNSNHWEAKDVVKAVKKRLQHKNPKVQLLVLTLLETMVKNCGDYVHFQIAEKNILQEMTKIVKKRTDMHVRDKILALLDSWQDAFGGPGGKYPQYYWAYDELRRSGVSFPRRSADAAPIFTPPVTHISPGQVQVGYGMPSHSSKRLDEAMASDIENLSRSNLDSIRNVMEVLADILQTVNPSDGEAVKDELIVDLETQCRSNQRKLMQMLTSTVDEELLGQGLELNDSLQSLLAKHDAIASGSTFPAQVKDAGALTTKIAAPGLKPTEVQDSSSRRTPAAAALPVTAAVRAEFDNEEEEEDDFAQLARRHTRTSSLPSTGVTDGTSNVMSKNTGDPTTSLPQSSQIPTSSNALALLDPPAPVRTTKEQDIIDDLLSLTLSTTTTSPHTPHTAQKPSTFNQRGHLTPISIHPSQTSLGNEGHATLNSYVAPWALPQQSQQPQPQLHLQQQSQQPQPQLHLQQQSQQPQPQPQPQPQSHPKTQPQTRPQHWGQPQLREPTQNSPMQTETQPQTHSQHWTQPQLQQQAQSSQSRYPAPPWATTAGYYGSKNPSSTAYMFSTPQASTAPYVPLQGGRPLQNYNSFPSRGINESSIHGDALVSQSPRNPTPTVGHKPFIPSYRLFEDLNVLGNVDGRGKVNGSTSSVMGMSGSSGRGMVSGARNKQKASEC